MQFSYRLCGVPCIISVDWYEPASPMQVTGSGFGDAIPGCFEDFEFTVLDRNYRRATWLEAKLTDAHRADVFQAFKERRRYT